MTSTGTCTSIINLRYQDGSEGSQSNPAKYKNQDYMQLKDDNLRKGRLFVDSTFPPSDTSLGDLGLSYSQRNDVEWLRPSEILRAQNVHSNPIFCSKGTSRFDFSQGYVGNCWFLAAISSLTFHKHLMAQVVPMDQSFNNYAGIFHFRFWRFGKWVDVVIDDYLPTYNKQLLLVSSKGENEFWGPLLEKAYAKVCGSYADMSAGLPADACKDFSGGVSMTYLLKEEHSSGHDEKLWLQLSRATGCNSMICCGTAPRGGSSANTVSHTGLVDAHAYSITAVTEVTYYSSKVKLVRIMNPWGKQEWSGKWSDNSDMWKSVSQEDREKCFNRDDGEFWMELEDFCYYFNILSICCENPNFLDGDYTCQWKSMTYDGSWVAGISAGGNVNKSTFATNPQYRIDVKIIDKTEQEDQNVVLSLMQKPEQQHRKDIELHPTALTIFKVPPGTKQGRLDSSFFRGRRPVKDQQMYSRARDVIELHSLQPGEYVIVPSTMEAYTNAEFVLTVYTKADAKISPHTGGDDHDDHDDHDHDNDHDKEEEKEVPKIPDEGTADSRSIFDRYADQYGELSAKQLQKLLNDYFPHGTQNGFSVDSCSSMIALVDLDKRMTMTYTEFSILWKKIHEYKDLFHRSDLSRNGSLSDYELQKAIEAAGIDTNDTMVTLMMFRYSGFSSTSLEQFICLMLRLENTSNTFNDKSINGTITLTWEEWSTYSMYS